MNVLHYNGVAVIMLVGWFNLQMMKAHEIRGRLIDNGSCINESMSNRIPSDSAVPLQMA